MGSQARLTPVGSRISTRVVISKVRQVPGRGAVDGPTIADSAGRQIGPLYLDRATQRRSPILVGRPALRFDAEDRLGQHQADLPALFASPPEGLQDGAGTLGGDREEQPALRLRLREQRGQIAGYGGLQSRHGPLPAFLVLSLPLVSPAQISHLG